MIPIEHRFDALAFAGLLMALGTLQSIGRIEQRQGLKTATWCLVCGWSLALASLGHWHENPTGGLAAGMILAIYGGWLSLSYRPARSDSQPLSQSNAAEEATP